MLRAAWTRAWLTARTTDDREGQRLVGSFLHIVPEDVVNTVIIAGQLELCEECFRFRDGVTGFQEYPHKCLFCAKMASTAPTCNKNRCYLKCEKRISQSAANKGREYWACPSTDKDPETGKTHGFMAFCTEKNPSATALLPTPAVSTSSSLMSPPFDPQQFALNTAVNDVAWLKLELAKMQQVLVVHENEIVKINAQIKLWEP